MIMSETFIKVDSLKNLEIPRQTYPTNLSKSSILTLLKNNSRHL